MPPPDAPVRCAAAGLDPAFVRRVRDAAAALRVTVTGDGADDADVLLAADGAGGAPAGRPVVVVAAHGDEDAVVRALAGGAADVVTTRTRAGEVAARVLAAARRAAAARRHEAWSRAGDEAEPRIVGRSAGVRRLRDVVRVVADVAAGVRIEGEPGTGRGLVARVLHRRSARASAPLFVVDALRLGAEAARARLFGTDAAPGAVADAAGATLLVRSADHLDDATLAALAEWASSGAIPGAAGEPGPRRRSDARLLVTCAGPAGALGDALSGVEIRVPALRDRGDDAALLLAHFLRDLTQGRLRVAPGAAAALRDHDWPGNVAELRDVAALLALRRLPGPVDEAALRPLLPPPRRRASAGGPESGVPTLAQVRDGHILRVMELSGGARGRAAKALGIPVRTLYNHLRRISPGGTDTHRP